MPRDLDPLSLLGDLLGRSRLELQIVEEPATVGDPSYNVADMEALRSTTGFTPRVSLEEGLAMLVAARAAR